MWKWTTIAEVVVCRRSLPLPSSTLLHISLSFLSFIHSCISSHLSHPWTLLDHRDYHAQRAKHPHPPPNIMAVSTSSNPITSVAPSSSPITSVSQTYPAPPIYNNNGYSQNPELLSRLNLDLRGRIFPVEREMLMLLPESVLLGLFPQGLILSKPASWEGGDDGVFTVDVSEAGCNGWVVVLIAIALTVSTTLTLFTFHSLCATLHLCHASYIITISLSLAPLTPST
jgi:hypothetical protein